MIKLAERLIHLDSDIEAYLHRPPFIRALTLTDECGEPLEFQIASQPHALTFHTRIGDFGLTFQDHRTLVFGLPPGAGSGAGSTVPDREQDR